MSDSHFCNNQLNLFLKCLKKTTYNIQYMKKLI